MKNWTHPTLASKQELQGSLQSIIWAEGDIPPCIQWLQLQIFEGFDITGKKLVSLDPLFNA